MIFIAVKFPVKPEYADQWIEKTRAFTEATRAEEGNKSSSGPAASRTRTSSFCSRLSTTTQLART